MPLNRPALTLGRGSRGVQDARRWVVLTCRDIGRDDLTECAELGVSELVTNALLHGAEPVQVRVRGTVEHPRVEVRDASTEPPVLPEPALAAEGGSLEGGSDDNVTVEDESVLLTFGRGLSIVARASDAWGADIEADGKVVWFSPAARISEDAGVEGIISGDVRDREEPEPADPVDVRVLGVPLRDYQAFSNHFRELRREVRLLALAHAHDYPFAGALSELFESLDRLLRDAVDREQLNEALVSGADVADLAVRTSRSAARPLGQFLDLLEVADEFARQHRLLALARTPEQVTFQRWFLGEYVRQADGAPPVPWSQARQTASDT